MNKYNIILLIYNFHTMKTRDQIEMIDLETGKLLKEICVLEYKLLEVDGEEDDDNEDLANKNFEREEYKTAEREQAEQEISEL